MENNKIILTKENIDSIRQMASSMTTPFIIYINQVIDMNGTPLSLVEGTVYRFEDGGMIKNTVVNGGIQIEAKGLAQIFDNATVPDMLNYEVPIEWFGGVCYVDNTVGSYSDQALANAVVAHRDRKILFKAGYYYFSNSITIARSGITLSGTKSSSRHWAGFRQTSNDGNNSVSTLKFLGSSGNTFFNIACNGIRMENLLLAGLYTHTAVNLIDNCISFHANRCHFNKWGKGISRIGQENDTDSGLSRCIIEDCTFSYIEGVAIEANVHYITYNIIRDSWFHLCRCPIRLVSTAQLLQDNSIENCNIDHVRFDEDIYDEYNCCCAIYLESGDINHTHATNNISRCYFERVGFDFDNNNNCIVPSSGCTNSAAVICRNCNITVDNNFFTSTPRLFLIDDCSSISIDDNGIGKNHTEVNDSTKYFLSHNAIVEVVHSTLSKTIKQVINYGNAIPILPDTGSCFIDKLVNFDPAVDVSRFVVRNYYETRFTDYRPQMLLPSVVGLNARTVSSLATIQSTNVLQVDYDPSKYTGIGYNYHPLRLLIYIHYTIYCDIYEVAINMSSLSGSARLRNDDMQSIYGATGLLTSYDIIIQTKSDPNVTGRFYIYVNSPEMNPTFKPIITSEDIRLMDVTGLVNFANLSPAANTISVRKHRGTVSTRPSQSANSMGYEFYDTANSRKTVWNGTRWLVYKAEPEGAATSGTTSQRPTSLLTSADKGFTYFDTTLGKPIYWNGSGWVNANGVSS